jgi:hypothetical protein
MPVILATWEVEIRRMGVQDFPERKKEFLKPHYKQYAAKCSGTHLSSQPGKKHKWEDHSPATLVIP